MAHGLHMRTTKSILKAAVAISLLFSVSSAESVRSTASVSARRQVTVRDARFHSAALGRDMRYRIILPAGYEQGSRRYPVLYLLHGLGGSYVGWESRSHLAEYVTPLALISVMAAGDDSWYANSAGAPQEKFEDYIATDLIAEIDKRYRTIAAREGRAIAGVSMGGYGAMKLALKFPRLFAFAASFSGAQIVVHDASFVIPFGAKYNQQAQEIFGPAGAPNRVQNDIFELAQKADPASLPYLWVSCGTEDNLLASNREFAVLLHAKKILYEYHESPGAHTWAYWDKQLPAMLQSVSTYIALDQPQPARPAPAPARVH